MYKINDIPLRNYGLRDGRASNSNIALSGFLDMPPRLGKTHHDWSDELGTQPYVLASEINFAGTDIVYHGIMRGNSKADAIQRVNELYTDLSTFTDVVTLSSAWGSWEVYVKDAVESQYIGDGWVRVQIPFRQPLITTPTNVPTGSSVSIYHIDYVPYADLGAVLVSVRDNFNRPQTKQPNFTAYGTEGYQVTRMAPLTIRQELFLSAPNFETLKNNVEKLHSLLAAPGTRFMNVDNMERECFNTDGFTVNRLRVMDGKAICHINFNMVMVGAGVPVPPEYLLDHQGIPVLDFIQPIRTPEEDAFILDTDGYNVLTTEFEKLTT